MKQIRQKSYQTERLVLRRLRLSDWAKWREAQEKSYPKQDEWDSGPAPLAKRGRDRFRKKLTEQNRKYKAIGTYIYSIFIRETGEFIGWIDISTIVRDPLQIANLGYYIINSYQGVGYAREATKRIIEAAFDDLKFHRLEAVIDLDNKKSIRHAKACGLYREGIRRFYYPQGSKWTDQVVYIAVPELYKRSPRRRAPLTISK
jgi:[ribosomal protein S5]-alanine N-acetyltransferase